jgi:hypothetical protein
VLPADDGDVRADDAEREGNCGYGSVTRGGVNNVGTRIIPSD